MTKNQITYLLVLATLAVGWLYFNTFFMAARINPRINLVPGSGRSMMGDFSQRQPGATPIFPKMQNGTFVNQSSVVPSSLPPLSPEIQKPVKTQGSVPAEKK
ncbi:MAG: hypothetical protein WC530_02850 [Candidatus Omnitrophota bacterium]